MFEIPPFKSFDRNKMKIDFDVYNHLIIAIVNVMYCNALISITRYGQFQSKRCVANRSKLTVCKATSSQVRAVN